jgi:putative ABC transport system permease protein
MALGADRRRILRLVIADGLRPVLAGGLLGLAAGAGLSYLVGAYYYRLPGIDWAGVMVVAALVAPAAALACYLPARRAAETDPNTTLREL